MMKIYSYPNLGAGFVETERNVYTVRNDFFLREIFLYIKLPRGVHDYIV